MQPVGPGRPADGVSIFWADTTTCHDVDPPGGALHHGGDHRGPGLRGKRSAGCENAIKPQVYGEVDSGDGVRQQIDGTVQRLAQIAGCRDETHQDRSIQMVICRRCSQYHAGKTGRSHCRNIGQHHLHFGLTEAKVAGAWPDHGAGGQGGFRSGSDQPRGGGKATKIEGRTKLDSVSTAFHAGFNTEYIVDADFDVSGHGKVASDA